MGFPYSSGKGGKHKFSTENMSFIHDLSTLPDSGETDYCRSAKGKTRVPGNNYFTDFFIEQNGIFRRGTKN